MCGSICFTSASVTSRHNDCDSSKHHQCNGYWNETMFLTLINFDHDEKTYHLQCVSHTWCFSQNLGGIDESRVCFSVLVIVLIPVLCCRVWEHDHIKCFYLMLLLGTMSVQWKRLYFTCVSAEALQFGYQWYLDYFFIIIKEDLDCKAIIGFCRVAIGPLYNQENLLSCPQSCTAVLYRYMV